MAHNSSVLQKRGSNALPKDEGYLHKNEADAENMVDGRRGSADDMLAILGYQSELTRNRSTWQVAFMSFVLASVPYGLATTLYYPLIGGGPVAVIWGWVAVCLIIICVAISLGEITSVYPTAGGVYYQTYMLSPPWCRNITAWICGWAYTLGNMTITLSVNFGTTLFIIGCVNIFTDSEGNGIWTATTYQTWLLFVAITIACNMISALGNKWLPILDVCLISCSSIPPALEANLSRPLPSFGPLVVSSLSSSAF
jgi:amino acid permease